MPDWLKTNLPMVIMFTVGTYVGLQTLEVKFTNQEQRASERYRMLVSIQAEIAGNTKHLVELHSSFDGLNSRLIRVETYVPVSITELEKRVMLIDYKLEKGKIL